MALLETYDEDDGDEDYFWDYWEDYWNLIQKDELWSMYLREINRKTH
jgi:hypothetical protein